MHKRKNYAVSELLGIVYILMISTTLISAIYLWAPQQINDRKDRIRSESMLNQFETVDSVLSELLGQGVGSSKVVTMMTDEGYIHLSQVGSRFVVFHPTIDEFDFTVEGFDIEDPNYNNEVFTYYQEMIPDYYWDLEDDDRKIQFQIYDLIQGTSDEFLSDPLYYPPQDQPVPITVRFNSEDSYVYTDDATYEWDFGGLGTSSQENPIFTFGEGEYEVSFTLDNGAGSHTISRDLFIGLEDEAHAGFYATSSDTTFSSHGLYSGILSTFHSTSVPSSGNELDEYTWTIEPGIQSPRYFDAKHNFLEADEYEVELYVKDTGDPPGNESWKTHTYQVYNPPPIVDFTFTSPSTPDGTVILTSTTTDFEGGGPVYNPDDGTKGGLLAYDDDTEQYYAFWDENDNTIYDSGEDIIDYDPDNGDDATPNDGQQGGIVAFCPILDFNIPSEPYIFIDGDEDWKYDAGEEIINGGDLDFDKNGLYATPTDGDEGGLWALYEWPGGTYYTKSDDPFVFKDEVTVNKLYDENEKIVNNDPNADTLYYRWDIDYDGETYEWYDWGYDANSIIFTPNDVYGTDASEGVHTILLQVEDAAGSISERSHDVVVKEASDSHIYTGFSMEFMPLPDPNPYNKSIFYGFVETIGDYTSKEFSVIEGEGYVYIELGTFVVGFVEQHGNFEIALQCENSDLGFIDEQRHSFYVERRPPKAAFRFDVVNQIEVTSEIPLEGTIRIDVNIKDEEGEYITAGNIWLFDIGAVSYEAAFGQKDYQIILENGAVLSTVSQSGLVSDEPEIYDETRLEGIGTELVQIEGVASDFIMNIVQFLIEGDITIGPGGGHHKFNIQLVDNEVLENSIEYYSTLKMQIFGEEGSVWRRYFTSSQGFEDYFGDTIQYKTEDTSSNTFMLGLSSFSVDVEVLS